ncbi:sodium-dependent proline transporter-like [Mizuhopecten yessoensis]|uniref:Sodium-and chloride-dependent glycine transporter 2 n=1 Tax=Mizuhopecten yessoensis TaxID=6573 RepID=A0A210QHX0_MIZYE|nr:sodium-dependent proline transporter-like [Mizuhopecten yessoensis]OWF48191.1 Sodium- and chloride-dependent glycine transporter 2 [Mizuhopecten yessoensis]
MADENDVVKDKDCSVAKGIVDHIGSVEECSVSEDDDSGGNKNVPWASRLDFIVSLLGMSLGISDIWRVPYLVYRNGGGAFLIPYITLLLVCGLPLYYMELEMSQFSGKGLYRVWDFAPLFRGICITMFILGGVSMSIYPTMRAWTIEFLVNSFRSTLPWSNCNNTWNTDRCVEVKIAGSAVQNFSSTNTFLMVASNITNMVVSPIISVDGMSAAEEFWQHHVLALSSGIEDVGPINWRYVIYLIITHILVYLSLVKSVKSFGKVMYVTALLPIVLVLVIWIRALALPGALSGMAYFITPDFSMLLNSKVWIEAGFMAFYTLGPGWGGLATFGCHNKFNENILTDVTITTVVVLLFGLLNGLVVFAVVGVMAEESGIPVPEIITSGGFSLGFVAYPQAMTYLPFPQVWSVLFFLALLMPGMDMQTVTFEPMMNILEEAFPRLRKRRLVVLGLVTTIVFLFELPFLTRAGAYIFQLMDWYGAAFSVVANALLEAVVFFWIYGGDRISRDVTMMFGRPLPGFIRVSGAYITPVALFMLLVVSFLSYRPPTYGTYIYPDYCNVLGWTIVTLTVLPLFVTVIVLLLKSTGTLTQRFHKTSSPMLTWGPVEPQFKELYRKSENSRDSSFLQLAWFNLTGRVGIQLNNGMFVCDDNEFTAINTSDTKC